MTRAAARVNQLDRKVTVCSACLRASCWQSYYRCNNALIAGTTEKTVAELVELGREHFDFWGAR